MPDEPFKVDVQLQHPRATVSQVHLAAGTRRQNMRTSTIMW